jgi:hypothetical protein
MCWKEKIQWQGVANGLRKEHVLRPPFLDKVLHHFFFLMVICNSLLLLKSLPSVTVIIQLVSRDHVCRFENGSQMAE